MKVTEEKTVNAAYKFALWSGLVGDHRLYLGDHRMFLAMAGIMAMAIMLVYFGYEKIAACFACINFAVVVVDLVRLPSMTRAATSEYLNGST